MYFRENQLSPGSIGILPLTTTHPSVLQHTPVRASSRFSSGLTLVMVSSPGFGSFISYLVALFRLGFPAPPPRKRIKLMHDTKTRRLILQ